MNNKDTTLVSVHKFMWDWNNIKPTNNPKHGKHYKQSKPLRSWSA